MAAARAEPVEAGKDDDCRGAQGRRASASSTCVAGTVAAKAKQVWTPARCAWGASGWGWPREEQRAVAAHAWAARQEERRWRGSEVEAGSDGID